MSYTEKDIAYENKNYFVLRKKHKKSGNQFYEVYKIGVTHSTRCAIIGYSGEKGLTKAIQEIKRREKL